MPTGDAESRLRPPEDRDRVAVQALNEAAIPHVTAMSDELLAWFVERAAFFRVLESGTSEEPRLEAFVIALQPGLDYASLNYRWFTESYGSDVDSFLYVDRIVVASTERGRGTGQRLYRAVAAAAQARGAARVTCEVNLRPPNEASLHFHRRFGFREVGRQETESGAKEVALLALELSEAASRLGRR